MRGDAIDFVAEELLYWRFLDLCLGDFILNRLITSVTLRIFSLSFSIANFVFDMDNGLFMLIIYSSNTQEKQSKIHYNKK